MDKVDITIIVCTFNRAELLPLVLEKLLLQETDDNFTYEILIIDNGSKDNTKDVVKRIAKSSSTPVRYFIEDKQGLAFARNRGVREADGKWIVFFDDDQLAEHNWLRELYTVALSMGADCVGGRTLLDLQKDVNDGLGRNLRGLLGESDWGDKPLKLFGKKYPNDGNVIRKKEVFSTVGNFDTTMIRGGQDQDLTRRAIKAGFTMWYAPNAIAYHIVPSYRLDPSYFKWASYRHGQSFAYMDYKQKGFVKMLILLFARIGQAVIVHVPILLYGYLGFSRNDILWRKSLFQRTEGYFRTFLYFISPNIFKQKDFFNKLEFRRERKTFANR